MFQNYMGESVGQHIGYELRMLYYEKLQRLSFSYHAGVHTGDLITRGILDVEGVSTEFPEALLFEFDEAGGIESVDIYIKQPPRTA